MVFARETNDNLISLVKKLDAATVDNKDKKMCSFICFLSDEEGAEKKLKEVAEKAGIKKLVFSIDNVAGPKGYNIAKEADVTVVLYNARKVEANHAFKKGELDAKAIERILADVPKILPK
jgi:hypothetical protein